MAVISQTFASCPAVLPIDASAVDASISALDKCISALETSIHALDSSSPRLEQIAIFSAFLVLVGVVLEIVGLWLGYRDERRLWRTGILRAPEHPSLGRFWFEAIAILIVIVGVFGEALTSLSLASLNNQLRSATTELRSKSDRLVGLITLEAANARAKTAQLDCESGELKKEALNDKVELAKITGKPYAVRINTQGVAELALSQSNNQNLVLTKNARLVLPTLPKGKHLDWTLVVAQDSMGQHQFRTEPFDLFHGNTLDAPALSSRVCRLTSDSTGTRRADPDCGYNAPPKTTNK